MDLPAHYNLIDVDRRLNFERWHPGVLTDRPLTVGSLVDVQRNDVERLRRPAARGFSTRGMRHGCADVWWKIGRRLHD